MAEALAGRVLDRLTSFTQLEHDLKLTKVIGKDLEILNQTLMTIRFVLSDAEEKQLRWRDQSLNRWLDIIKDVMYDLDDLLDELCIETLRSQQVRGQRSSDENMKVSFSHLFPCFNCLEPLSRNHKLAQRIKLINERLDAISEERVKYHLEFNDAVVRSTIEPRMTSNYAITDDKIMFIVGLDHDKGLIMSKLMMPTIEEERTMTIITIIGMGGIGKTTLAKLVFNDEAVISHFDTRVWVSVSQYFDVEAIVKQIVEIVTGRKLLGVDTDNSLVALRNSITGKRFLLVLDDVWNEDHRKWDTLKHGLMGGAEGSRILVTTRNERTGYLMSTTYLHHLRLPSEDEAWGLFSQIALMGRNDRKPGDMLEHIGMELVKLCKGHPLTVTILAGLMRSKRTTKEWRDVLESEIWETPEFEPVLPALYISYHDLPSPLKQCISYCSIFPKDYEIQKDMLIKLWMAQGFLGSTTTTDMEIMGEEYIHNLVQRSFFQDVKTDEDDKVISCKMHDLIHDLIQSVTRNECYIMETDYSELNSRKFRHLSISNMEDIDSILPSVLYKTNNNLLTLKLFHCRWSEPIISPDLFHHLVCLRVLDLSFPNLEDIPSEIEKLIHLRYLDLSGTRLECLPETICNLYNLQTLKLNGCTLLCMLPRGLKKLINLRHLEIEDTDSLCYLPQGVARLNSLRSLSKFIVGTTSKDCKLGELKDLNLLRGSICIKGLSGVESQIEADEAGLKNKQHLSGLTLDFSSYELESVRSSEVGRIESVLQGLQPPTNLTKLEVCYCDVLKLPTWMSDSILSNLRSLTIDNCRNCMELPALGKLPSLEKLRISNLPEVKHINHEFYGIGSGDRAKSAFPKLEELYIVAIDNLEEWELAVRDDETIMPCLRDLFIVECPRLVSFPHNLCETLKKLHVSDCPELIMSLQRLPLLHEKLTLEGDIGLLRKSPSVEETSKNI